VKPKRILVTGASGYIGALLAPKLRAMGYRVRCMVRNPDRLAPGAADGMEVVAGDALEPASLAAALEGVDAAYYLIHSMAAGEKRFEDLDETAARNFSRAAREARVGRIIYLSGLGTEQDDLSAHLRSRHSTGKRLAEAGVPVTELRAGSVVGSGSLSFEIIRYLTERLPLMILPRWTRGRTQPIAVADALRYLAGCLEHPETTGRVLEIGGADVLSYLQMMSTYARVRGLRRLFVNVPVLTPRLSSYWIGLVTPIRSGIAKALVTGTRSELFCRDDSARRIFGFEPMGFEQAVRSALQEPREKILDAREPPLSLKKRQNRARSRTVLHTEGMIIERWEAAVGAEQGDVFAKLMKLGGDGGWPYANALWGLRMFLDRLLGGRAHRRRRDPVRLRTGDPLDFWRVEKTEEGRLLRLRNEGMMLPGRAWLQYRLEAAGAGKPAVRQEAFFEPKGLAGVLYWYALYPAHTVIFRGMLRALTQ